jgi:uncharacterized membrane protein (UPF0127 family)
VSQPGQANAFVGLYNTTRGAPLARRAEVASGVVRRGLGLMGRRGWGESDALVLPSCNSVHSCFMRMPIDLVYLDRDGLVLRTVERLRPWRIGPIVRRADSVLELPAGALSLVEVAVGDRIEQRDPG